MRNKGRQSTTRLTISGRIKVFRRVFHSPLEGTVTPIEQLLFDPDQSVSRGVREMSCRLNNDSNNFDQAADNLARTAHIQMSGEQLRQLTEAEGRRVLEKQRLGEIPTAFVATDCIVDPAHPDKTRLYTGLDGVTVPLITEKEKTHRREKVVQKRRVRGRKCRPLPPKKKGANRPYKEFKTIAFYDEHGKYAHQTLLGIRRLKTGEAVRREAKRLKFDAATERLALVDGASWIKDQLEEKPLPLDGLGLDFYHLSENVHKGRRAVYGLSDDEASPGQVWARGLLHVFKHEGYTAAWNKLMEWRTGIRKKVAKRAADRLINYVSERRDMISYPEFIANGWKIGSGPLESRCKTTTSRLKNRSRRWDAANAESIAALTTLMDSGQWNLYWKISGLSKT
jgi:hypothetical protein